MALTMNLFQSVFTDFNPSKFIVYTSLFFFFLLFALKLDGFLSWSFWVVFIPLWIWKGFVVVGSLIGIIVWVWQRKHRDSTEGSSNRLDLQHNLNPSNSYTATNTQFKAMLMAMAMQLLLLVFEILACEKLESHRSYKWMLVFTPLIFISILSVFICVWSIKNDRSLEAAGAGGNRMAIPGSQPLPSFSIQMELICSINILQFIFVALRLDNYLDWSWSVVFIPLWVLMILALIVVLYTVILACLLLRSPDMIHYQRRGNINTALGHAFFVVPLLIFEIMLTKKLDHQTFVGGPESRGAPYLYTSVAFPLLISFLTLLFMSFGTRGGNPWWFGIRKDFCSFLVLNMCPLLQEYGNISYQVHLDDDVAEDELDSTISTIQGTISNSSSYESHVTDTTFPNGLPAPSFSTRFFKFKKKGLSPSNTLKNSTTVPVLYLDMPD